MKRSKLNKGRALSTLVLGLAAVSLISVGFSAWVIQTTTTEAIENVTVNVAEVKNNSIAIHDAGAVDGSFLLDAEVNDSEGDIIYEGEANQNDLSWSIKFDFYLTEDAAYSTTTGTQKFQGIYLETVEKYTEAEGSNPLYTFSAAETDGVLDLPVEFGKGNYIPLLEKNAFKFNQSQTEKTIYLSKTGDKVHVVTATDNFDIKIKITKTLSEDEIYLYHVDAEFFLKWGDTYLGFNPSLCDGANATVNAAFENAGKTLPNISSANEDDPSIEKDLTKLSGLNAHQINHLLIHDPTSEVSYDTVA